MIILSEGEVVFTLAVWFVLGAMVGWSQIKAHRATKGAELLALTLAETLRTATMKGTTDDE